MFPTNFPSLFDQPAVSAVPSVRDQSAATDGGMFSVNRADVVLVSAVKGGRLAATVELTGMADVNELLGAATAAFRHLGGLVTLRMRNRTQGTTGRRVVMLGRVGVPFPFRAGGGAVCTAS